MPCSCSKAANNPRWFAIFSRDWSPQIPIKTNSLTFSLIEWNSKPFVVVNVVDKDDDEWVDWLLVRVGRDSENETKTGTKECLDDLKHQICRPDSPQEAVVLWPLFDK